MTPSPRTRSVVWFLVAVTALLALIYFALPRRRPVPAPVVSEAPSDAQETRTWTFEPPLPAASPDTARIGLILDDFGASWHNVDRCLALPYPIAIAVIPHLTDSVRVSKAAQERGFDVFLHQPMEPHDYPKENPGKYGIYLMQSPEEVAMILQENIASLGVPIAGVNNHMGSRATETPRTMEAFFDAFPSRLIFLDSRTSAKSVAYDVARSRGIPALKNTVFLDHVPDSVSIEKSFDLLLKISRTRGRAIGLGHVNSSELLRILEERLPALAESGVRLVRLSDLLPPQNP